MNANDIRTRVIDTTWSDVRKINVLRRTDKELVALVNTRLQSEYDRIIDDIMAEVDCNY